jgi:hypothetical protein
MTTGTTPNDPDRPARIRERPEDVESYKLARAEELRILDLQRAQLESMRTRAAQYLAFGGAATGFLVGTGLSRADRDGLFFTIAGIATFVSFLTVALAVSVFVGGFDFRKRSASKWQFALPNGFVLRTAEADIRPNESQINAYLARSYWKLADANRPALTRVRLQYVVFLATGAFQLLLWVILLWARG